MRLRYTVCYLTKLLDWPRLQNILFLSIAKRTILVGALERLYFDAPALNAPQFIVIEVQKLMTCYIVSFELHNGKGHYLQCLSLGSRLI
jgi:hypothetical protein